MGLNAYRCIPFLHMNAQISSNTFGFSLRFVMFVMFAHDEFSETFLLIIKSRWFLSWKFFHAQVVFFSFISGTLGLSLYSYMAGMNVCILVLFFMKSFCNRRCGREHLEIISADFHQIVYSMRHRSLQNLYPSLKSTIDYPQNSDDITKDLAFPNHNFWCIFNLPETSFLCHISENEVSSLDLDEPTSQRVLCLSEWPQRYDRARKLNCQVRPKKNPQKTNPVC